ncbi:hypothetical protein V6N11_024158 [Hibiscus sabdariffa]|uniref:DUF4283 domain-containing protein n=1 Tax=Hibiscus sabdariffa TaxID=183260 RepID=A0ABR1ZRP5_9ROSI
MDVLLYGKPSGKPPKDILMLSSSSSRERPGSPIADVDQNVVKKGCVGGSLNMSKVVKWRDMRDYEHVLTEGPWKIYGSYLTIQPWSKSFSTSEKHPTHMVVWVHLPGLPYKYYSKELFHLIATVVGKVIKVDYNTSISERGKFVRIVVDLYKPFFTICGKHAEASNDMVNMVNSSLGMNTSLEACVNVDNLYGPWMVVDNHRRRQGLVA